MNPETALVFGSLGVWTAAMGLTLFGTRSSLKHLKGCPPHLDAPFGLFPVSILKPLKGADEGMRENLKSFFELDYPGFELLFSVADPRDPACEMVRELMALHPRVQARLIIGDVAIGPNPKVNNLITSYGQARHDWLLIADSNVRVPRDYLRRLAAHIETGVGIITSIVAGRDGRGVGGHLEATFLNTFYARGMKLAFWGGRPCVMGKSMFFQRSTAERFGGIKTLARYLAEDFIAGEAIRQLGLKVVLMTDPIPQHIGNHTFQSFWSRHLRWGRIRKAQAPFTFFAEPWFGPLPSGLLGAWAFSTFFQVPPSLFILLHLATWSFCDLSLMRRLGQKLDASAVLAWFLKELVYLPLWFHIACGNTVNWRGRNLRIQSGGLLETT